MLRTTAALAAALLCAGPAVAQYLPARGAPPVATATPLPPLKPVEVAVVGTPFAAVHAGEALEFDVRVDNHGQGFDAQSFRLDRGPRSNWSREFATSLRDCTWKALPDGARSYHVVIPRGTIAPRDVHRFTYYFTRWPNDKLHTKNEAPGTAPGADFVTGELGAFKT